jgi:acyl carrier protein
MEVFVLDSRQRLSPVGVPGEIYLGGELSGEYLNDPAGTAERLVPNVFSRTHSALLFRTGDLGRWLPNGTLEVLRRRDSQVKIRGYRIEIGEIEASLAQHSGVSRCAVVVREDRRGDRQIVAYWIAQGKTKATTSTLRQHLLRSLPEYMVPSFFVRLDSLPLTPNGKLDRKALPAPDACRPDLDAAYVPPRSPIEEALASIWCEVLGVSDVGVHDNFFELGGHSLLATRVVSRLTNVFEFEIPLRSIFEYPTIEALAIAIVQSQDEIRNPAELASLLAELEKSEHGSTPSSNR